MDPGGFKIRNSAVVASLPARDLYV